MTGFPVEVARTDGAWFAHMQGDLASTRLLEWWDAERDIPPGFRLTRGPARLARLPAEERSIGVDQTNRSVVVAERAVVKWTTGPLLGPHPASTRIRRLVAAGFREMPLVWGILEWRLPEGEWVPVVMATELIPAAVDGWTWCLHAAEEDLGVGAVPPVQRLPFASDLGTLTARMHRALADNDTGLVAVHGDFHVGQILRDDDGRLYVVDFDGNPTVDPIERCQHRPAAYDVAGMLLSLENVGHVARRYHPELPDSAVIAWTERVQSKFLAAYRPLAGHLLDESLLPAYIDDQIQRELDYADTRLPSWRYVPEAALRRRGRS